MKDPIKALEVIEILTGDSFGLDMEFIASDIGKGNKVSPKLKEAAKRISDIYMIAHAEVSNCRHSDWEKKKYEILRDARRSGLISSNHSND